MGQLAGPSLIDDLLAVELVLVELVAAPVLDDAIAHPSEERCQAVVIRLRPGVEGVVVAAGTLQADAQEYLGCGLGPGLRVAQGAVVVGGGLAVGAAPGGNDVAGKLIERLALGDTPA